MIANEKPRDVVLQTLKFQQPATCPFYVWVDYQLVPMLAERYGQSSFIQCRWPYALFSPSYTALTEVGALPVKQWGDRCIDEYGSEFRTGSALHIEIPPLSKPSLEGYAFPDLATDAHFEGLDEWCNVHADRFKIVQLGMMFFERTWFMRGMENIFMDLCAEPVFVNKLLDELENVNNRVIDYLVEHFGDRIDAIGFSDDYGGEKSLMIGPRHWREFFKPRLKRMYERIHKANKYVYLHTCGNVAQIIPDLIEIEVDMLQPIQPEAMDIYALKREFGKDICLVGGIGTQTTLPFGSVDDVRREIGKCLEYMASGGGYILAPSKTIMTDVPIENAIALIEAFTNQNGY